MMATSVMNNLLPLKPGQRCAEAGMTAGEEA